MNTQPRNPEKKEKNYYFETADLVIIALFAALGGISSTFIANMARVIFFPLGLPGSGQIISGLHIIWFVLIYFWVGKKFGAIILTGILKGFVELFTGNSIGITAIIVALGGAITFEVTIYLYTYIVRKEKFHHIGIAIYIFIYSTIRKIFWAKSPPRNIHIDFNDQFPFRCISWRLPWNYIFSSV